MNAITILLVASAITFSDGNVNISWETMDEVRKAAESGITGVNEAAAQFTLGMSYFYGDNGLIQDNSQSFNWLEKFYSKQ